MLFATSFSDWFPWVIVAIAAAATIGLAVRFVVMYRDMKREKFVRLQASSQPAPIAIDGEFFVLTALHPYAVGEGKPLAAGSYVIHSAEGAIALQYNGVVADYNDNEVLTLHDGDVIRAERDLHIKPVAKEANQ